MYFLLRSLGSEQYEIIGNKTGYETAKDAQLEYENEILDEESYSEVAVVQFVRFL